MFPVFMRAWPVVAAVLAGVLVVACGGKSRGDDDAGPTPRPPKQAVTASLSLVSSAFEDGGPIPSRHTCDGEGLSPALAWGDPPAGTQAFGLIVDDAFSSRDARTRLPDGTITLWVLFNIPATARSLAEGISPADRLPDGSMQGRNDFRDTGWGGPCPPGGTHRYRFFLYALDVSLGLAPGVSKQDVLDEIEGHVLAQGTHTGTYSRQ